MRGGAKRYVFLTASILSWYVYMMRGGGDYRVTILAGVSNNDEV